MPCKLYHVIESIPLIRKQLELAATRCDPEGGAGRRVAWLLRDHEETCSAEAQCDPTKTVGIIVHLADVASADTQYGLKIAQGLAAARKSLSRVIKRSPDAPAPGTVATWAAVLDAGWLRDAMKEAKAKAAGALV